MLFMLAICLALCLMVVQNSTGSHYVLLFVQNSTGSHYVLWLYRTVLVHIMSYGFSSLFITAVPCCCLERRPVIQLCYRPHGLPSPGWWRLTPGQYRTQPYFPSPDSAWSHSLTLVLFVLSTKQLLISFSGTLKTHTSQMLAKFISSNKWDWSVDFVVAACLSLVMTGAVFSP